MREYIVTDKPIFTLRIAEALSCEYEPGHVNSQTGGRTFYSFIYTVSGTMRYAFSDISPDIIAEKGQVVFLPKGASHESIFDAKDTKVYILQFDFREDNLPLYLEHPVIMPEEAKRPFQDFVEELNTFNSIRCVAKIYELLWMLSDHNKIQNGLPRKYQRLFPGIAAIARHSAESHPVSYYAELCGMSDAGFRRSFKEYMNMSVIEYRNKIRLMEARKLIRSGEYSIEEAAEISGFSNLSFFYKIFRRTFGYCPGESRHAE